MVNPQQWTSQIGSAADDIAEGVVFDAGSNRLYLTGFTAGGIDVDTVNDGAVENDNAGVTDDVWLAQYSPRGELLWFRQFGTPLRDRAHGVTSNNSGEILITGETSGDIDPDFAINNQGFSDPFIAKYDDTGNRVWITQFGSTGRDFSQEIITDNAGNSYIAGFTDGNLGGANQGQKDVWLAKFNDNGGQVWIRQFGSIDIEELESLTIDSNNNLYLTGSTRGNLEGTNAGETDAWIASYDSNGDQRWIQQFGTPNPDISYDITVDDSNDVYLTGSTRGTLEGSNQLSEDAWLAKYSSSGQQQWVRQLGDVLQNDVGFGVSSHGNNQIFVTGETQGNLGGVNGGGRDIFIAEFDGNGNQQGLITQFGSGQDDTVNDITLDPAGNIFLAAQTDGSIGRSNPENSDILVTQFGDEPINEPPVVIAATFTLEENSPNQFPVGLVEVIEPDGDEIQDFVINNPPDTDEDGRPAFVIDDESGIITVNDSDELDFEKPPIFSLTVAASDPQENESTVRVFVPVDLEPNTNNEPLIPQQSLSSEDTTTGTILGRVAFADPENKALELSIVNGDPNDVFSINPTTGELEIADGTQINGQTNFQLEIQARELFTEEKLANTGLVTVNLEEETVNPEAPFFNQPRFIFNPIDATTINQEDLVGAAPAIDFQDDSIRYEIREGNLNDVFEIDPNTGQLFIKSETPNTDLNPNFFTLNVGASDGDLTGNGVISIQLEDVNDPPVLVPDVFSIDENPDFDDFIGALSINDQDDDFIGVFDAIVQENADPNGDGFGAVNIGIIDQFGNDSDVPIVEVSDTDDFNFENASSFTVVISVSDGDLSDQQEFVININNVNEPPVLVEDATTTIDENSEADLPIPIFTDPENDPLTFSDLIVETSDPQGEFGDRIENPDLNGNGENAFRIDNTKGEIVVNDPSDLDFERIETFFITVTASDGEFSETGTVEVNLRNVNDNPPSINLEETIFEIREGSSNGIPVTTIPVTDADGSLNQFSYSVEFPESTQRDRDNDGENAFVVEPLDDQTGELRVNDSDELDFEEIDSFTLNIIVSDGNPENDTGEATVIVNLTNVNEPPEVIIPPDQLTFTIQENSRTGITVGEIEADDPDGDTPLFFSIDNLVDPNGNGALPFSINPNTGLITVADTSDLDFETTPSFNFEVVVGDRSGDDSTGRTDRVNVTVNLEDIEREQLILINTDDSDQLLGDNPVREVEIPAENEGNLFQNNPVSFDVFYTPNPEIPGSEELSGLGLRLHYNSSKITFNSLEDVFQSGLFQQSSAPQADTDNFDGDTNTDQFINVVWGVGNSDDVWAGVGETPTKLYTANFTTRLGIIEGGEETGDTQINFSASTQPGGFEIVTQSGNISADRFTYDIDDDGDDEFPNALTDGRLILRFLFGNRGETLTDGIILEDGNAQRTDPEAIVRYLKQGEGRFTDSNGQRSFTSALDVDGSGEVDALTDGILINRFLLGFTGSDLIEGAVGDDAELTTGSEITDFITDNLFARTGNAAINIDDQSFTIDEESPVGTLVGTVEVTNNTGQELTYEIIEELSDNPNLDRDTLNAFRINDNGAIEVNDSADTDFEGLRNPNNIPLEVQVTVESLGISDTATITVSVNNIENPLLGIDSLPPAPPELSAVFPPPHSETNQEFPDLGASLPIGNSFSSSEESTLSQTSFSLDSIETLPENIGDI